MTALHHARLVLRLVPVVLRLWWADVREPGAALRVVRVVEERHPGRAEHVRTHIRGGAVAAWCLAWAALLWGGATLHGALACAVAGVYSLIALTVHDRLEAL